MNKKYLKLIFSAGLIALSVLSYSLKSETVQADPDNAGLKLPVGFGALKVAELGAQARHLVITPQGLIYVKLNRLKNGKGIMVLQENQSGKAEIVGSFGNYFGTGIFVRDGYLYSSSNAEVFRYKLDQNYAVLNPDKPEKIITGLKGGEHPTKSLVLDKAGNIYVNVGANSNSCQEKDRQQGSMGIKGCPILDSAGGIWQFKCDKQNQTYKDGIRYATGLRNVVGIDWNEQLNQLFVMQHGRDQLHSIFPTLYNDKESALLPAECLYGLKKGDNAGWPYMYYDQLAHKKIMAPEYGGDGKKEAVGDFIEPAAAYPGHMAPNGLLFYTGSMFPEKYKNGAFIAFHGSWNRSPEPQAGYFVVFQPFKDGKPSGECEIFADNFSGSAENTAKGRADHRPCGLAQGKDGSLYVSDDAKGSIYRIIYTKK